MKYYLLTFNDDYADEHNVPALQCFDENDYNKWLKEPSGKLNKRYEEEKAKWDAQKSKYEAYIAKLQMMGLYSKRPKDMTDSEKQWMEDNKVAYVYSGDGPKRVASYIQAHLGNGGDSFEDAYTDFYLNEEFTVGDYPPVDVLEVSKSFYDTFHKAGLSGLSLCNIFHFNEDKYIDEDEDEEDDEGSGS